MVVMVLSPLPLPAQEIRPFQATRLNGFIGFGVEREKDTRDNTRTGLNLEEEENSIFEEIGLGLNGYLYHPRLFEFQAETEVTYEQRTEKNNFGFEQDLDERFSTYTFFSEILKEHPVSFWLQANRNTQTAKRTFQENNRIISEVREVGTSVRNKLFPFSLGYNTFTARGEGLDKTDDEIDRFFFRGQNYGRFGNTSLRYEKEKRFQEFSDVDQDIDELDFSNNYNFGAEDRHWLRSLLNYRDQTGTRPARYLFLDEYLFLRHTDHFQTYYNYSYDDTTLENDMSTRYQYRGGLRHQLYESLYTQLEFNSNRFRVGSGSEYSRSAALDLSYSKKIPYGILYLDYDVSLESTDENFSGDAVPVRLEKHNFGESFAGNDVIFLDRDVPDPDSIEFVDEDDLPLRDPDLDLVEEGIHYSIEEVGTLIRIRLLSPDGDFLLPPPGPPGTLGPDVFLNYSFEPSPPIDFETLTQRYAARLWLLESLRLTVESGRLKETLRDGIDLDRLDDVTSRRYGLELYWKNSETRAEKVVQHSRRNPFERQFFSETLLIPIRRNMHLNFRASYGESTTLLPQKSRSIDRNVSAKLRILLPRRARWEIEGRYGNQDLLAEDLTTIDFWTKLEWKYQKLDLVLSYEDLNFQREITGDERQRRLFLEVRRFFGQ
jgi:hypothetical protein